MPVRYTMLREALGARPPYALEEAPCSETRRLDAAIVHYEWTHPAPPRRGARGHGRSARDAADGYYTPASTGPARGPGEGPPPTGPIADAALGRGRPGLSHRRRGAGRPSGGRTLPPGPRAPAGDALSGLVPPDLEPRGPARSRGCAPYRGARVAAPLAPFPGVLGTALDEPGGHSTMPPEERREHGTPGSSPPGRPSTSRCGSRGGLLSVGDAHAPGRRRGLHQRRRDVGPRHARGGTPPGAPAPRAPVPDRWCSRAAAPSSTAWPRPHPVRRSRPSAIRAERGLTREEAYVVASVAADLRISDIVDAPNCIVSAFLPRSA